MQTENNFELGARPSRHLMLNNKLVNSFLVDMPKRSCSLFPSRSRKDKEASRRLRVCNPLQALGRNSPPLLNPHAFSQQLPLNCAYHHFQLFCLEPRFYLLLYPLSSKSRLSDRLTVLLPHSNQNSNYTLLFYY